MKTLELRQMEEMQGGNAQVDCGVATGLTFAAVMIMGLAGGPFTWWTVAGVGVAAINWAYDCRNA